MWNLRRKIALAVMLTGLFASTASVANDANAGHALRRMVTTCRGILIPKRAPRDVRTRLSRFFRATAAPQLIIEYRQALGSIEETTSSLNRIDELRRRSLLFRDWLRRVSVDPERLGQDDASETLRDFDHAFRSDLKALAEVVEGVISTFLNHSDAFTRVITPRGEYSQAELPSEITDGLKEDLERIRALLQEKAVDAWSTEETDLVARFDTIEWYYVPRHRVAIVGIGEVTTFLRLRPYLDLK